MSSLAILPQRLSSVVRAGYWILGAAVILLALVSYCTQMTLQDLMAHIEELFGVSFVVLFSVLVALAAFSIVQLHQNSGSALWAEVGLQAANGISTLALTFTLLGISLGIGSLSTQALTPDTVQHIIGELTAQFSMAFMTTVIGLPTATLFRAVISVMCVKQMPVNEGSNSAPSPQ
ncbi:hypothetical protein ACFO4O_05565 [Glaciecola siphonariae]|uniref:MotA/TolQ/ExbB proton channel domain-containing protein n=1 Tax=Glaciecola siphonariae TaxID=521012 RepID=A0ABV9LSX6_9ALTE